MTSADGLVVAKSAFNFDHRGLTITIRRGAVYRDSHPFAQRNPGFFEKLVIKIEDEDQLPLQDMTVRVCGANAAEFGTDVVAIAAVRTRPFAGVLAG